MIFIAIKQIAVALALALLVGSERERSKQKQQTNSIGGVRTFGLLGICGAVAGQMFAINAFWAMAITIIAMLLLFGGYLMAAKQTGRHGLTSELAAVLVFFVGVLVALDQIFLATIIALLTTIVLYFKEPLHKFVSGFNREEIHAAFQFILIAFVVLPLIPNRDFGPLGLLNPYNAWLMVVLISGLSFLSYIAIKLWGAKKGIGLTGFLAGFISSTALTLAFAGDSKKNPKITNPYVVAIIIANSAMFFRVLVEVALINPNLVASLIVPLAGMGITGLLCAIYFWKKTDFKTADVKEEIETIKTPLKLTSAIKFGVLFLLISFVAGFAGTYWGNSGLFLSAITAGIIDVDAITVSLANLTKSGTILDTPAVIAVLLATITNTFVKLIILFFLR